MSLPPSYFQIINQYFVGKPVKKAYLFGSYVRGQATSESDIDLLVELDYDMHIGLQFVQMQLDLQDLLQKKIDLVSENGMSPYIKPIVDKEKQLIYVR